MATQTWKYDIVSHSSAKKMMDVQSSEGISVLHTRHLSLPIQRGAHSTQEKSSPSSVGKPVSIAKGFNPGKVS